MYRQLTLDTSHFAPSDCLAQQRRAYGPGARSNRAFIERAGSHLGLPRAPLVPGPFATTGRAVSC